MVRAGALISEGKSRTQVFGRTTTEMQGQVALLQRGVAQASRTRIGLLLDIDNSG